MNEYTLCAVCGFKQGSHRGADGRCPASDVFPTCARLPANASSERVAKAEALWDKRIARHWSKRTTTFTRMS